jgi:hypothetical protein
MWPNNYLSAAKGELRGAASDVAEGYGVGFQPVIIFTDEDANLPGAVGSHIVFAGYASAFSCRHSPIAEASFRGQPLGRH